jgi:hypothetical protein
MANVALIAPLLGPLVGAAWVHILPWEMMLLFTQSRRGFRHRPLQADKRDSRQHGEQHEHHLPRY